MMTPPGQAFDLPAPELDVPARSANPRRHPGDPTKAEMDAHNLTHLHYSNNLDGIFALTIKPQLSIDGITFYGEKDHRLGYVYFFKKS